MRTKVSQTSGDHAGGVPPVPIPNTEVKTSRADDTWGASPWESRSSPGNKQKGYLLGDSLFCVSVVGQRTGIPHVRIHIAGVCVTSGNVAKVSSDFRHTAGVCVSGRSVAISSSAYRIPNTEVKDPHCRGMRFTPVNGHETN